ncbi:claudin-17 isoform X5 [Macaca mulatta]
MAFYPLQIAGLVLGFLGMVGTLATTLLPQWRVSAFVGSNIIVFERLWEGLWMNCIRQARARLQCKFYSSLLALPPVLETARALMCVAVALSLIALLIGICGMKQVQCTGSNERAKAYLLGTSGVLFILTGIFVLIPIQLKIILKWGLLSRIQGEQLKILNIVSMTWFDTGPQNLDSTLGKFCTLRGASLSPETQSY